MSGGRALKFQLRAKRVGSKATGSISMSWMRESRSDKASELPLWIAQFPLALGALLFTLQSMTRFTRVLRGEPGEDETLRVGQDAKAEAS